MQSEQGKPIGRQNINIDKNFEKKLSPDEFISRLKKKYTKSPAHIPFKILRDQKFINEIFETLSMKFDTLFKTG